MGVQVPPNESLVVLSTKRDREHTIMHFGPWGLVVGCLVQYLGPWHRGSEFNPSLPRKHWAGLAIIDEGPIQPPLDLCHIQINLFELFGLVLAMVCFHMSRSPWDTREVKFGSDTHFEMLSSFGGMTSCLIHLFSFSIGMSHPTIESAWRLNAKHLMLSWSTRNGSTNAWAR